MQDIVSMACTKAMEDQTKTEKEMLNNIKTAKQKVKALGVKAVSEKTGLGVQTLYDFLKSKTPSYKTMFLISKIDA